MFRLHTNVGDKREQHVDIKLPTFPIESDVHPPTFEKYKIGFLEDVLINHSKTVEPLSFEKLHKA